MAVLTRYNRGVAAVERGNSPLLACTRMVDYLSQSPQRNADLIFVLAGRENRKQYGLELLRQGVAPRILFSVARFEIRRFSSLLLPVPLDLMKLASTIPAPQRHFFVLFDGQRAQVEHVRPVRFGTLTEIESLCHWLSAHSDVRSLLIVSSKTHLRRIRMCCDSLLNASYEIGLIAAPEASDGERSSEPRTAVLFEILKAVLYCIILALRRIRLWPSRKCRKTGSQA